MPIKPKKDPKTGIYQAHGTYKGVRVRSSTRAITRLKADDWIFRKMQEIDALAEKSEKILFADIAKYYIQQGGEKRFLRPLITQWGETAAEDLGARAVSDYCVTEFAGKSPAHVKRSVYVPLNAIYNKALDDEVISFKKTFKPPKVNRKVVEYPEDDWFNLVMPFATLRCRCASMFMTYGGARVQETLNLTRRDVSLDRREAVLKETKNGDPRRVALHDDAHAAILEMWGDGRDLDAPLFTYTNRKSVYRELAIAARDAGAKFYSPHQVGRHAFAARLLANGASLKTVQEAGGWKSIKVVADTYGHLEQSHVDDAIRGVPSVTQIVRPNIKLAG